MKGKGYRSRAYLYGGGKKEVARTSYCRIDRDWLPFVCFSCHNGTVKRPLSPFPGSSPTSSSADYQAAPQI